MRLKFQKRLTFLTLLMVFAVGSSSHADDKTAPDAGPHSETCSEGGACKGSSDAESTTGDRSPEGRVVLADDEELAQHEQLAAASFQLLSKAVRFHKDPKHPKKSELLLERWNFKEDGMFHPDEKGQLVTASGKHYQFLDTKDKPSGISIECSYGGCVYKYKKGGETHYFFVGNHEKPEVELASTEDEPEQPKHPHITDITSPSELEAFWKDTNKQQAVVVFCKPGEAECKANEDALGSFSGWYDKSVHVYRVNMDKASEKEWKAKYAKLDFSKPMNVLQLDKRLNAAGQRAQFWSYFTVPQFTKYLNDGIESAKTVPMVVKDKEDFQNLFQKRRSDGSGVKKALLFFTDPKNCGGCIAMEPKVKQFAKSANGSEWAVFEKRVNLQVFDDNVRKWITAARREEAARRKYTKEQTDAFVNDALNFPQGMVVEEVNGVMTMRPYNPAGLDELVAKGPGKGSSPGLAPPLLFPTKKSSELTAPIFPPRTRRVRPTLGGRWGFGLGVFSFF